MNERRKITAIIKDHVQVLAVFERGETLVNAPEVFLLSLPLPSKDRDAGGGNTERR